MSKKIHFFVASLIAIGAFWKANAWSVDVADIDWPSGKKLTYSIPKNEDFEIPDLKGFNCTVIKNPSKDKNVQKTWRVLLCNGANKTNQFQIRTLCLPTVDLRNNLITITRIENSKSLRGYTIALNCD